MLGISGEHPPYYIICYSFKFGKQYIHNVDMNANSMSRTRVWTSQPHKAYQFKEKIDAELVAQMFFDNNDPLVSIVCSSNFTIPMIFSSSG